MEFGLMLPHRKRIARNGANVSAANIIQQMQVSHMIFLHVVKGSYLISCFYKMDTKH